MKIPKFEDNYRNYTFILSPSELKFATQSGRVKLDLVPGRPFLRSFWREAAKVRSLLDLAKPAKSQAKMTGGSDDPRHERASGAEAYFAALEQAVVAIVSAWEVFTRDIVRHVLNCSSFVDKLARQDDQPLRKLVREFRLLDEISLDFVSRGLDASRVNLGDIAAYSRRGVRWQNLEDCKTVVATLFPDVKIASMAKDWNAIKTLFEDRHKIVHAAGEDVRMVEEPDVDWVDGEFVLMGTVVSEETYDIIKDYDENEIEAILGDLLRVAEKLHERLFSVYQPDP